VKRFHTPGCYSRRLTFFPLAGTVPWMVLFFNRCLVQTLPWVLWGLERPQRETRLSVESAAEICEWCATPTNPNASTSKVWCLGGVEVSIAPGTDLCVCVIIWWAFWWLLRSFLLHVLALLQLAIVCCWQSIKFLFFGPNGHESIEQRRLVFAVK
jgi:hypothetical protein